MRSEYSAGSDKVVIFALSSSQKKNTVLTVFTSLILKAAFILVFRLLHAVEIARKMVGFSSNTFPA